MKTPKFSEFYEQLNKAQKKAVNQIEGAVMVVAGPGTGKTQVLTLRIANILLKTDVNPENILALTFTESAVLNMRSRLVEMIGTQGFRVELSTFHGFCNDIIRSHPEDFPHMISSASITELEQIEIVERLVQSESLVLLKPFGDPLYYVRSIVKTIDELKKEGVTVVEFKEALKKQKEDFEKIADLYHEKGAYKGEMKGKYQELQRDIAKNEESANLYEKYQQALFEEKVYDFNDMLLEVLQIFQKNKGLLLSLQERYQYILIDEHQDTNSAQNKIIELLCSFYDNPNLFVVGDEKQAIFRFQGASLENFIYFKKLYPEALLINLTDNYRSNQVLLDGAGSLISQNSMANVLLPGGEKLTAQGNLPDEMIKIVGLSDYWGEYHYIVDDIENRVKAGENLSDMVVIARNNRDLLPLADVLESRGLQFSVEADANIFADPQVKKLILFFKAIHNFGDDAALITALHIDCLSAEPFDIFKIMRYSQKHKMNIVDIITSQTILKQLNLENPKAFNEFFEKLKGWEALSFNEGFENLFVSVLNDSGLMKWVLKQPNSLEVLDKFTGLFEDIKLQVQKKSDFSLKDFMRYLELLQKHEIIVKKAARTIQKDAIRLMTAHKSKGLEFNVVYIINAYDGHWGNPKKRGSAFKIPWEYVGVKLKLGVELDENEDERRLFYVALTRARKEVVVTYSTRALDGKEQVPSQFIAEIQENSKVEVDSSEFEQQFLAHKETIFAPKIGAAPQIKSKEFLNAIFLDRGLSVTALNNYIQCPWKYFYRNLLLLPDVKTKSLVFGSAIHKALSVYLKSLSSSANVIPAAAGIQKKKMDPPIELEDDNHRGLNFLLKAFEEVLLRDPMNEKDTKEMLEKGKKVLTGYFESGASKWKSEMVSEMFIRGVKLEDNLFLNGMIDMIEPVLRQGSGGQAFQEVVVYDFKTGKPKSKAQISGEGGGEYDYNYKQQLVFYKLLLDKYQFKKWKVVKGVIDFVEPDTKGKYHREEFEITSDDVAKLEDLTRGVGKEIYDLSFWDRRCGDRNCQYCALADMTIRGKEEKPLLEVEVPSDNFIEVDPEFASLVASVDINKPPIESVN